jgi:hypothetical protein
VEPQQDPGWVARFDACERHAGFAEAMSRPAPGTPVNASAAAFQVVFMIFFLAVGGFILSQAIAIAPTPMVVFAIAVVGIGAASVGRGILRPFLRVRSAGDVERCLAVIAEVGGGRASLAYRNGKRREVAVSSTAGELAPGEIGVVYLRAGDLVGFARLA